MSDSMQYVCYDIRGIQQYIFAVPNLKCIIGGSALIDGFDGREAPAIAKRVGVTLIFGGGGRGTFHTPRDRADDLIHAIVEQAHALGLDIRIGRSGNLSEATAHAQMLYSFAPASLDGEPCRMSGLWPVSVPGGGAQSRVHPMIQKRLREARSDPFGQQVLEEITRRNLLPGDLQERADALRFMKNVNPDPDDSPQELASARRGQLALGGRNRWAILAMDGNDMGVQHRSAKSVFKQDIEGWTRWLTTMSQSLQTCTRDAAVHGLGVAISEWWEAKGRTLFEPGGDDEIVLPFRPLLIGGDDVLILAHCSHVLTLARTICRTFEELSVDLAKEHHTVGPLWPATDNRLTISAGILYLGATFPLAAGIRYTESLLAGAKAQGRRVKRENQPSPATLDWEQLTEKAIDTPHARRLRELRFTDGDLDQAVEVRLTQRPWLVADLENRLLPLVEKLEDWKVPRSILVGLQSVLRSPYWERSRHLAMLKKQQKGLCDLLGWQPGVLPPRDGDGWRLETASSPVVTTPVLDAVLLMQESSRMSKETVHDRI